MRSFREHIRKPHRHHWVGEEYTTYAWHDELSETTKSIERGGFHIIAIYWVERHQQYEIDYRQQTGIK